MTEPAQATSLLSMWADEHVRVADVLRALDDLRRPEVLPPTRTSVLTLVIVASTRALAEESKAAVMELGGRHPARVITLVPDAASRDAGLDAEVRLLGGEAEGHALWFEDIELVVRGEAARHLDSFIEPFTLSDLPVAVWFAEDLPVVDDPLLRAADVAIVDARTFGDTACFGALATLSRAVPVVDLSWQRLRPWRQLLAGLFDRPDAAALVGDVQRVRVVGRTGPRHVLAGWIAERLRVPLERVLVDEAEHVSIEVVAGGGVFAVDRMGDERLVRARADLPDGPTAETTVPLPPNTPAWGLAEALSRLERDVVFERALRTAIALASRARH